MNKKVTRVLVSFLSVCMLSGCAGKDASQGENKKNANADVWSCSATFKVLQDVDNYEENKGDASIQLDVAKGEYEASQLIISAKKDLTYDLTVSELTSKSGNKFPEEQIDVFHEKYMKIDSSYNGDVAGMYPDAIVPLKNIKEYGENKVKAGDNQGIYVRFHIPLTQEAGVYTGEFTLELSGKKQSIPVTLNVMDVEVSEVNHTKSIYVVSYGFWLGEQEGTQEMLNKYNEMLYDYRINSANLMLDDNGSEEDLKYFVDLAYEYMQNPNCSFVRIQNSADYLYAFAKKSFETGYNMLEKCGVYFIDEPDGFGIADSVVESNCKNWIKTCKEVADAIAADKTITSPIKDAVVQSIRECENVVTTADVERYRPLGVSTFCPGFTAYDTQAMRDRFKEQNTRWWYGCIYPRAPYPNYSIDIQSMTPIRVMGWMQADYDVAGNLFWAVDYNKDNNGDYLDDYYSTASRFPNTNGDGFLLYPGRAYGIDGPVASLRLEAVRDAFEEYELLRELKLQYDSSNEFDSSAMISRFAESLYYGAKVTADDATYQEARTSLLNLCMLNASEAKVSLIGYEDDKLGKTTYQFYANEGAVLRCDGKDVTEKRAVSGGYVYTIVADSAKQTEALKLEVQCADKTYVYNMPLKGQYTLVTPDAIRKSDITSMLDINYEGVVTVSESGTTGNFVKLGIPKAAKEEEQTLSISGNFISGLNADAEKAVLKIYMDESSGCTQGFGLDLGKKVTLVVSAKFKNNKVLLDLATGVELVYGTNLIEIPLTNTKWDKVGELEYIQLKFGEMGEEARTVYIGEMSVNLK